VQIFTLPDEKEHSSDAITSITPANLTYIRSDEQLEGDLQLWQLEETFQPMNLPLLQARSTYSSPSTPFCGNVLLIDVHRFS